MDTAPTGVLFFNDTATTEISTLSLRDALPIYGSHRVRQVHADRHRLDRRPDCHNRRNTEGGLGRGESRGDHGDPRDRKSTRLNSSHSQISYAVFCLKKKNISRISQTSVARGCS